MAWLASSARSFAAVSSRVERRERGGHLVERHGHRGGLRAAAHRHAPRPVAARDLARRVDDVAQRPRRAPAEHGAAGHRQQERRHADPEQARVQLIDQLLRGRPVDQQHQRAPTGAVSPCRADSGGSSSAWSQAASSRRLTARGRDDVRHRARGAPVEAAAPQAPAGHDVHVGAGDARQLQRHASSSR